MLATCMCACAICVSGASEHLQRNCGACAIPGFYLEILFWGGNMVDKDSKKGHNTLLCTVGAFATSQL